MPAVGFEFQSGYPLVPTTICRPDGSPLKVDWALVDSGSDMTHLPMALMPQLGLTEEDCDPGYSYGNDRQHSSEVLRSRGLIPMMVGGYLIHTRPCFRPGLTTFPVVLGRDDFFRHFDVRIEARWRHKLWLTPYEDVDHVGIDDLYAEVQRQGWTRDLPGVPVARLAATPAVS